MFLLLAPLAILSFAVSVWGVRHAPAFTFFMAPTRIWELFAGALLALGLAPAIEKRIIREALSWLGLGLIGYAIIVFTESTRFPGLNALFPVAGAVLLIHCARGTSAGWLLSHRIPVFIGLIWYSLYLWHWPIIVFSEYRLGHALSGLETVAAIAASLIVATMSWRYVERPFRVKGLVTRRRIFQGAATAMVGCWSHWRALPPMGGPAASPRKSRGWRATPTPTIRGARNAIATRTSSSPWRNRASMARPRRQPLRSGATAMRSSSPMRSAKSPPGTGSR